VFNVNLNSVYTSPSPPILVALTLELSCCLPGGSCVLHRNMLDFRITPETNSDKTKCCLLCTDFGNCGSCFDYGSELA